ncbi:MAG: cobalamin B12-binding domain-containing protein [Candidatus Humimicrobiaceae bacterium]
MGENRAIYEALISLNEKEVKSLVSKAKEEDVPVDDIMSQLQEALIEIGNRFEKEEYFVPDLIYSGVVMKEAVALLGPLSDDKSRTNKGKVVLGTVYGDVHNIGKDLVAMLLTNAGFEVIDLGFNVEPAKFVDAIKESSAKVVGMSCLLTISFEAIANTVNMIKEAGFRDQVSIMVGGGPVTELVAEKTGCDFYGKNAFAGVKFAEQVYSK